MSIASKELNNWYLMLATFFVALMLTFLRLPGWAAWVYPQWLVLMVLYWAFVEPGRVGMTVAWFMGLFLDVLYNVPFGENALALVLAVYVIAKFGPKIVLLGFFKKWLVFFGLFVLCQLLPLLMQLMLGELVDFQPIFTRSIVSTLMWSLMMLLFNHRQGILYFESRY